MRFNVQTRLFALAKGRSAKTFANCEDVFNLKQILTQLQCECANLSYNKRIAYLTFNFCATKKIKKNWLYALMVEEYV